MTGKMGLQRCGQEPHLNDQENGNNRDCSVNGRQAAPPRHSSTPVAIMSSPCRLSVMRGSARGGGPCKTEPSPTEKYPSWHGHSSRLRSRLKYTAHDKCVHFWL